MSFQKSDDTTVWLKHDIPMLQRALLNDLVSDTPPWHLLAYPRYWNLQRPLDTPWRMIRSNGRGRGAFVFPCDCTGEPEVTIKFMQWAYNNEIMFWVGQCTSCFTIFWSNHTEMD